MGIDLNFGQDCFVKQKCLFDEAIVWEVDGIYENLE